MFYQVCPSDVLLTASSMLRDAGSVALVSRLCGALEHVLRDCLCALDILPCSVPHTVAGGTALADLMFGGWHEDSQTGSSQLFWLPHVQLL